MKLSELVGQAWSKNRKKAPFVIRTISHCNKITNWVIDTILSEDTPRGRARVLGSMISLLSVRKRKQESEKETEREVADRPPFFLSCT